MATDSYMAFLLSDGKTWLPSESQVDITGSKEDLYGAFKPAGTNLFEVEDYSFDIEQTLNIGSQSSGAGAGKVTFNPFSITRKIDKASPLLFDYACSGSSFQTVLLGLRKSVGAGAGVGDTSGQMFLRFDFKLVAVKTISWSHDEESPKETITFEYGGLQVRYAQQDPNGKLMPVVIGGWNRVTNKQDHTDTAIAMR